MLARTTFSVNNLSAHALAGIQRYFSGGRICRFCMPNYDEIGNAFTEEGFRILTKDVNAYHSKALQECVENGPIYGVLNRCPLVDLPYFDATAAFVPDIVPCAPFGGSYSQLDN